MRKQALLGIGRLLQRLHLDRLAKDPLRTAAIAAGNARFKACLPAATKRAINKRLDAGTFYDMVKGLSEWGQKEAVQLLPNKKGVFSFYTKLPNNRLARLGFNATKSSFPVKYTAALRRRGLLGKDLSVKQLINELLSLRDVYTNSANSLTDRSLRLWQAINNPELAARADKVRAKTRQYLRSMHG